VPAVRLAVQPAGRGADIQPDGVRRDRLEQMKDVEAQDELHSGGAVSLWSLVDLDVVASPEGVPRQPVSLEQLLEARCGGDLDARLGAGFADAAVARRVQRHHLLDPQRSALNRLHAEFLADPTRASLDDSTVGLEPLGAEIQARASCLGHPNPGLCGLHEEVDAFGGTVPAANTSRWRFASWR